jgi:hypothetical protein
MSEYVKDPTKANGWKVNSYGSKGTKNKGEEGAPVTADAMAEVQDDGGDEGEEPSESIRSRL